MSDLMSGLLQRPKGVFYPAVTRGFFCRSETLFSCTPVRRGIIGDVLQKQYPLRP
jgi:hypothetical protein